MRFFSKLVVYTFFISGILLFPKILFAKEPDLPINDPAYAAQFIDQSEEDPIIMEAGSQKTITIHFKNVGNAIWRSDSTQYISAYTVEEKYRDSIFASSQWRSKNQTAKIPGTIAPGKVGTLEIQLQAPQTAGDYVEHFYLASEEHSWVRKGYFFLKIQVVEKKSQVESTPQNSTAPSKSTESTTKLEGASAGLLFQSYKNYTAKGGQQMSVDLLLRNEGKESWKNFLLKASTPKPPLGLSDELTFADFSWEDRNTVEKAKDPVKVGVVQNKTIYFRAPKKMGDYQMRVQLFEGEKQIVAPDIFVNIHVTEDAPSTYHEPYEKVEEQAPQRVLLEEPNIRVGLWKQDEETREVKVRSQEDDYKVYNGDTLVGILPREKLALMKADNGIIQYNDGNLQFMTLKYVKLEPLTKPHAVFEVLNWERTVAWRGALNFNKYRGSIEYRYTEDRSGLYVINELLFEDYVAGIAEASNDSPIEYQKALLTAARTYAYYTMSSTDKHSGRNFDVVAHTGDQLYLGYNSELLANNNVLAARETRGQLVTYEGNVVITPYYGNSDGRTRSWREVWGGMEKPWLVSVPAVYDKRDRKGMFGHGVGMSQRDAAYRAEEKHEDWITLLKYYYTGTDVEKIYK